MVTWFASEKWNAARVARHHADVAQIHAQLNTEGDNRYIHEVGPVPPLSANPRFHWGIQAGCRLATDAVIRHRGGRSRTVWA